MHTVRIFVAGSTVVLLTRSFPNFDSARLWAEGYCRRHPGNDWEVV